jgi:hypothetical protein
MNPADEPCTKCGKPVGQKIVLGCRGHPHFAIDHKKEEFELANEGLKKENERLRESLRSILNSIPTDLRNSGLRAWMNQVKKIAKETLE